MNEIFKTTGYILFIWVIISLILAIPIFSPITFLVVSTLAALFGIFGGKDLYLWLTQHTISENVLQALSVDMLRIMLVGCVSIVLIAIISIFVAFLLSE